MPKGANASSKKSMSNDFEGLRPLDFKCFEHLSQMKTGIKDDTKKNALSIGEAAPGSLHAQSCEMSACSCEAKKSVVKHCQMFPIQTCLAGDST